MTARIAELYNTAGLVPTPTINVTTFTLTGSTGNDILNAPGDKSTLVKGLQGNDTITLALTGDVAQAGDGDDTILVAVTGAAGNTVVGGDGNDSITLGTAISVFTGSLSGGSGADLINFNGRTVSGAIVGANEGNDTIIASANTTLSTIGAGQGSDRITWNGGGTNSIFRGGAGADVLTIAGAATTSTIYGNEGHDTIRATALDANTTVYIGGGKGNDSIAVAAQVGTIVGGYLNDTITAFGTFGGGLIYADAFGEKTGGTGTGSSADGNDLISFTAGTIAEGTTVYGAGGNDTVSFLNGSAAASALLVDTGNGSDLIGSSATIFFSAAGHGKLNGGAGNDTIKFNIAHSGQILGGDGEDSIFGGAISGGASINGGAGNDTINFGGVAILMSAAANCLTINGGAGADSIILSTFTATTAAGNRAGKSATNWLANVAGIDSGDVIRLNNNRAITDGANWLGNTQIYVGTNQDNVASAAATGIGSVAVYTSGTDMVVAVMTGANHSVWARINVIGGSDLIKTTLRGQAVAMRTSNFGFSVGTTNNQLGFTFT